MNSYIKHIIEGFDFDTVNKQNKKINAIDILIKDIVYRIIDTGRLDTKDMHYILSLPAASYKANNNEIHLLVTNCVKIFGDDCNLNWIDVSNVTNMCKLFEDSAFNGDISNWDVSNVTDMGAMFRSSKFKGDISNWNVSNVIYMDWMFYGTLFNGDISKWDVRNVKDMHRMF
jgi:surface protein